MKRVGIRCVIVYNFLVTYLCEISILPKNYLKLLTTKSKTYFFRVHVRHSLKFSAKDGRVRSIIYLCHHQAASLSYDRLALRLAVVPDSQAWTSSFYSIP